jgi:hypothetical protein
MSNLHTSVKKYAVMVPVRCQAFESIVSSSDVDPESLNPDPDPAFQVKPPLLVQRCEGTTAGLGHLEVVGMPMHKFLLRQ